MECRKGASDFTGKGSELCTHGHSLLLAPGSTGADLIYRTLPRGNAKPREHASKYHFIATEAGDFAPLAEKHNGLFQNPKGTRSFPSHSTAV